MADRRSKKHKCRKDDRRSGKERRVQACRCDRCYQWLVKNLREVEK